MKKSMSKIEFPVLIVAFIITLCVSTMIRPSINKVDAITLDKKIVGVGKIKSHRIIQERELNGDFKNQKDFCERVGKLGVGEVVLTRITKEYNF